MERTIHTTVFAGWRCRFAPRGRAQRLGLPTRREAEVIAGLAAGWSQKQIAKARGVAPHTIRSTTEAAYHRLSASRATEAVVKALRRGWIAPLLLALIIGHHQPMHRTHRPAPVVVRTARTEVAA